MRAYTLICFRSQRKHTTFPLQRQICWFCSEKKNSAYSENETKRMNSYYRKNVEFINVNEHDNCPALKDWRKQVKLYLPWAQITTGSEVTPLFWHAISPNFKLGNIWDVGWMIIFRRKPMEACPSATSFTTNPTWSYPLLRGDKPPCNHWVAVRSA
jgi:hypothetical protein